MMSNYLFIQQTFRETTKLDIMLLDSTGSSKVEKNSNYNLIKVALIH